MIIKIKLPHRIKDYFLSQNNYYSVQSLDKFIDYFLPNKLYFKYIIVDDNQKSDITIYDITLNDNDNSQLRTDEINMLISCENCLIWWWYEHYNKYNDYNDNKINIYLYNHITRIVQNYDYISIPIIYKRIDYFNISFDSIKPYKLIDFNDKKFCLVINKSKLNKEIDNIKDLLSNIGIVDNINTYNNYISNASCYNSIELLNIFNQYKFIICFENSYSDGYITEKIFNCFFARTIPIYKGSPIIEQYINEDAFVDARNLHKCIDLINVLNTNETLYNNMLNASKISPLYNDENYEEKLVNFIKNKVSINNNYSENASFI